MADMKADMITVGQSVKINTDLRLVNLAVGIRFLLCYKTSKILSLATRSIKLIYKVVQFI